MRIHNFREFKKYTKTQPCRRAAAAAAYFIINSKINILCFLLAAYPPRKYKLVCESLNDFASAYTKKKLHIVCGCIIKSNAARPHTKQRVINHNNRNGGGALRVRARGNAVGNRIYVYKEKREPTTKKNRLAKK